MSISPEDFDGLNDLAWERLPFRLRLAAVARLRIAFDESFFAEVRRRGEEDGLGEWIPIGWHFGQGMHVRNVLRSDEALGEHRRRSWRSLFGWLGLRDPPLPAPIPDSALPSLPEFYPGQIEGNWDDYYVQCVEAAAGLRSIAASD